MKLNCYINFRDSAKDAITYYQSVFGGDVTIDTFRNYASENMVIDDVDLDKVMHAQLTGANGMDIMVSDTPNSMEYDEGSRVRLMLSGDDEIMLRGYWSKLADEGVVVTPLAEAPWGDIYGMLMDKFGIGWMVNISPASAATTDRIA